MNDCELREKLEAMIDGASVARVLEAMMRICSEKAEHIRNNWQDETSARCWDRVLPAIDRAAFRARKELY